MPNLILIFLIGCISGIIMGFFGVGGGFFLTPVLNILGLQIVIAIGTVFFSRVGSSLFGTWKHLKQGDVILKLGILLGLPCIGGIEIGKRFVLYLDRLNLAENSIRITYITILVLISVYMLKEYVFQRKRTAERTAGVEAQEKHKKSLPKRWISLIQIAPNVALPQSELGSVSLWVLVISGLLLGVLSGILGVGGGFISLPFLIYFIGVPTIMAVGTSLIIVFFASSYGTFTYAITGHVDWRTAVTILIGSILCIQLGVAASKKAAEKRIKILFSLLLLCVAVSVFLKQIGLKNIGSYLAVIGATTICLVILWPVSREFFAKTMGEKKAPRIPEPGMDKMTKK